LPVSVPILNVIPFNWATTVDHLGLTYGCVYLPNTYQFLVRSADDNCPIPAYDTHVFSITVLPTIPAPLITNAGGTLTVNASGYFYQWYRNRFPIPGATSQSFTPTLNGFYQARIMNAQNNGNYSEGFAVTTGVENIESKYNFVVYPNPAKDDITIQLSNLKNEKIVIRIEDMNGKKVFEKQFADFSNILQQKISTKYFATGVYSVKVEIGNQSQEKKITVVK
jgi:hypothetical protein